MNRDSRSANPDAQMQTMRAHVGATAERRPYLSEVQVREVGSAEEVARPGLGALARSVGP
jgi:hypothetical protein